MTETELGQPAAAAWIYNNVCLCVSMCVRIHHLSEYWEEWTFVIMLCDMIGVWQQQLTSQ